ncbi:MAG: adenosylcobinamide-phosphate synthase CbiB [Acidobacteriota bacterium]|nr:adenosylcobinamide-phosphate synthase CbiB [Acidobacteriota bacterium]MDE2965492.1 adenosylcobinamide-phosphate synthase CbiB [Acidobacteriota bacterium]
MEVGERSLEVGVLLGALVLDLAFRELPKALHPVVWMGTLASWIEKRTLPGKGPVRAFLTGLGLAVLAPVGFAGLAWLAAAGLRDLGPLPYLVGGALLLKTTFAVKGLAIAAGSTRQALESGRIEQARFSLRSLVSRDAGTLTSTQAGMAAIESVAENTTDSCIGPWLAFALLGLPGAVAYRALNTLDSMLGYHGRYEYLGKASARLDDLANLIPARLSAILMLGAGILLGLPSGRGWSMVQRDRRLTESPNAGWTISAMSGLLGVALAKPGHYRIGDGLADPDSADIRASLRVLYASAGLGLPVVTGLSALRALWWQ